MIDRSLIAVENVTACRICGASAHKLKNGCLQCSAVPGHIADGVVGIWSDLTYPPKEGAHKGGGGE